MTRSSISRARIRYNRLRRSLWWLANRAGGEGGQMLRIIYPHYKAHDPELVDIITERYGTLRRPLLSVAPRGGLLFKGYPDYIGGPKHEQKGR